MRTEERYMNKIVAWMKKHKIITGVVGFFVGMTILGAIIGPAPKKASDQKSPQQEQAQVVAKPTPKPSTKQPEPAKQPVTPSYKVIAKSDTERFDKKTTYYVLIDPVDLSNDGFKKDVKLVLQAVTKTNGNPNFTANVYDNADAATAGANLYNDPPISHGKAAAQAYSDRNAQHLIAEYNGGINGDTGKVSSANSAYSISWFAGANKSTPNVGKYVVFSEQWKP